MSVKAPAGRPLAVLAVEDSDDDYQLMLRALRSSGFSPVAERIETRPAMEAALAARSWDLVVADYSMPRFSGLEALSLLRESGLDIPFILVSGTVGEELAVQAMKAGAGDYIMKGSLARLAPVIERELREAAVRRERRRAEAAEREQRALADALRDIAAALNRTLDFDQVLTYILENVSGLVPHDSASILLVEHGLARVAHRRGPREAEPIELLRAMRLPVADMPTLSRMAETGQPLVVPDTRAYAGWVDRPETRWILSYVGMPILVKRQVIGFLNINSATPGFYGPQHAERLHAFADHAAVAIENARLYDASRREAARAEALARVAARLNAQLDLGAMLRAVCEETAQAMNTAAAAVVLYDERQDRLSLAASVGIPESRVAQAEPMARAAFEQFVESAGPIFVTPMPSDAPGLAGMDLEVHTGYQQTAGARMERESRLIGVLLVAGARGGQPFAEDQLSLLRGIADQAAQAVANARLFAESQRRLERLQSLRAIDLAITASLDLNLTLKVLLEQVTTRLGVHAADVLLLQPGSHTLQISARRGFRTGALRHSRLRLGEGHAGRAALERRTIHIPNLAEALGELDRAPLLIGEVFIAYVAVPLIAKGLVKGVMEIFHRAPLDPDPEWLDYLETLASQAAIAVDNAELLQDLQRSNTFLSLAYEETLEGWSKALDLRDRETEGHTRRVTEHSLRLARAIGVGEADLVHLRRGALLHDIGKMGIPDAVLLKPGPLTAEEWQIMRHHPVYAYEWLSSIAYLRPALDIPYAHHEKWDGSGYPRGLRGVDIPQAARIFAVVDVWDALLSDRPYRPGWAKSRVLDYLRQQSGTHFEPAAVETFLQLLAGEGYGRDG